MRSTGQSSFLRFSENGELFSISLTLTLSDESAHSPAPRPSCLFGICGLSQNNNNKFSYRSNRKKRLRVSNKEKMLFNIWTSSDCLLKYCPVAVGMEWETRVSVRLTMRSLWLRQTVYLSVCWFIGLSNYPSLQTSSRSVNINNICRASHVTL